MSSSFCRIVLKIFTFSILSIGGLSNTVFAASTTGTAKVTIVTALSVGETAQMNFGSVSPDKNNATTVQLNTSDGVSSLNGAGLVGGTPASGAFKITGFGTAAFTITLPADGVVSLTGVGPAMSVDKFSDSLGGSGTLSGGTATFTVGAELSVGADQTAGSYSGTYNVTVNYN